MTSFFASSPTALPSVNKRTQVAFYLKRTIIIYRPTCEDDDATGEQDKERMEGVQRLQEQLHNTFGTRTPLVVAGVVGVFSLAILWCLLGLFGNGDGGREKKNRDKISREREVEDQENQGGEDKAKKPKGKASKAKQTSKKVTLPSHPLLAGEFKGHTGAVLSIDMESNGKYLASCSEGMAPVHGWLC